MKSLVEPEKVLMIPQHIKLGLVKSFIYIPNIFQHLSKATMEGFSHKKLKGKIKDIKGKKRLDVF